QKVLRQFGEQGAILPAYQHFYYFLCNYLTGDLPQATRQAVAMTNDKYNHGLLARALVAAANGETDKAKLELARVVGLQRGWRQKPRNQLEKISLNASIIDRLTKDLAAAGLGETR